MCKLELYSKRSSKYTSPENFLFGGCFKRSTYHVTALGWLKKEGKNEGEEVASLL